VAQAHVHIGLAELAEKRGRPADSLRHNQQALTVYRATGLPICEANALNGVGWSYALLGDHRRALVLCTQALELFQALGDRDGQEHTWDSLGYAHRELGYYVQAAVCYRHAIDLCRDLGDLYFEADSLNSLGDTYHSSGNPDLARDAWRQALDILDRLEHPPPSRCAANSGTSAPVPVSTRSWQTPRHRTCLTRRPCRRCGWTTFTSESWGVWCVRGPLGRTSDPDANRLTDSPRS
jgi:tetratricopeptide (TPR) repeat protein